MSNELVVMEAEDIDSLKKSHHLLENPGWVARASNMIGKPIEYGMESLPDKARVAISEAVQKAIHTALDVALKTMDKDSSESKAEPPKASNWWHKAAVATSGAVGGAFGFAALAVELPISTTIMMRSIADVARSEGADLADVQTQLECVQVLALGGSSKKDDETEVGYFAVRQAMTAALQNAATQITTQGVGNSSAVLVKLIKQIAERFGITASEKIAAQVVPIIGAVGGAAMNTAFIDHFQDMAHGHFTVRRLERKYGQELIQSEYGKLSAAEQKTDLALEADPSNSVSS